MMFIDLLALKGGCLSFFTQCYSLLEILLMSHLPAHALCACMFNSIRTHIVVPSNPCHVIVVVIVVVVECDLVSVSIVPYTHSHLVLWTGV